MKKIEKITQFVSELFSLYSMIDFGFFRDYDEETEQTVEVPLFRQGKIDKETLTKLSIKLGMTEDEILAMDKGAALKYWNKYPFFSLFHQYKHIWEWNHKFKDPEPTAKELLINAVFADNRGIPIRHRYSTKSVKERLLQQLKEYDSIFPGSYHENAEITELQISTQTIFSFPQCPDMIRSFLDMVDRLQELFFKAIRDTLSLDEINELNFLAGWLIACDIVVPSKLITYDTVQCYRDIYREENFDDFYEYVKIKAFIDAAPWRCQEFFDDTTLVQRFVNVFPQTKTKMREFGINLTNFSCVFVWSDAKPIQYSDEEERLLDDIDAITGVKPIPLEERAKEPTHIYVKKNRSELYGWGNYIKTLKKAYGPISKGGLIVPQRKPFTLLNGGIVRISKRVSAHNGGSSNG